MPVRINVKDLSPPAKKCQTSLFCLTYNNAGKYHSHPLDEGEIIIGASPLCTISISAPGVRERHVSLKRQGNMIYIRGLGSSNVRIHGKEVTDTTLLAIGESFTMGSVTALVEYISPEDQKAAVLINRENIRDLIENPEIRTSGLIAGYLKELNNFIDSCIHHPGMDNRGLPMDILQGCFQPVWSVLARRKNIKDKWTILFESGSRDIPLARIFDSSRLHNRWDIQKEDTEYCLLIRFPDGREAQPLRNEFCRITLSLIFLLEEGNKAWKNTEIRKILSGGHEKEPNALFPWDRMAGSLIRSHLSRQTEMLRYSDIVMITGETGTGKELAARSLHDLWQQEGDFVAINCAAIPADLLDSELFGVAAGAATGVSARQGRFSQAEDGTLFLDEISEMPLSLQSKLLRVLQEKEYYPVGGKNLEKADVRVIASSNRTEESLKSEHMRQDLYFRLSQAVVFIPPLRERLQDMAELCGNILTDLENKFGRGIKGISIAALEGLKSYRWPGNIRELQNRLRNLYMSVPGKSMIKSLDLPDLFRKEDVFSSEKTLAAAVKDVEKKRIIQEINRQGSVREAAMILGLSEGYLYRKIKKLGIKL